MDRREFLFSSVAAAVLTGCRRPLFGEGLSKKAVQAYSIRDLLARDFAGTCRSLAKMGLDGLELWGTRTFDAKTVRTSLADAGLVACGAHVDISQLEPENADWAFDYAETVGYTRIIVPWLMPDAKKVTDVPGWWRGKAEIMNAAAEKARGRGLSVGYHNHDHEFGTTFGGRTVWEIFAGELVDEIFFQWDVGALAHADQDAAAWMRKYPGRCPTIHMKDDWDKPRKCWGVIGEPPPGRSGVDWKGVVSELHRHPVEWTIVEPATSDSLDTVERSLLRLRELGV